MRALNVLLALLVSLLIALLVAEGGLRLLGLGPQTRINRFDAELGWSKTPNSSARRATKEFDVEYAINGLGLRDDPMQDPGKAAGTFRVLFLGDSFVLGYTVNRDDLFVDVLETWWKAVGSLGIGDGLSSSSGNLQGTAGFQMSSRPTPATRLATADAISTRSTPT